MDFNVVNKSTQRMSTEKKAEKEHIKKNNSDLKDNLDDMKLALKSDYIMYEVVYNIVK